MLYIASRSLATPLLCASVSIFSEVVPNPVKILLNQYFLSGSLFYVDISLPVGSLHFILEHGDIRFLFLTFCLHLAYVLTNTEVILCSHLSYGKSNSCNSLFNQKSSTLRHIQNLDKTGMMCAEHFKCKFIKLTPATEAVAFSFSARLLFLAFLMYCPGTLITFISTRGFRSFLNLFLSIPCQDSCKQVQTI